MVEKEMGSTEKLLLYLVLFSLIFMQRLALTVGELQLSPVFLLCLLMVGVLFFFNKIEIHQKRLTIFLIAVCGLCIASLYGLFTSKEVGLPALLSLVAFYIPFLFIYRKMGGLDYILSTFQRFMMVVAVLGILQFLLQFVGVGFVDPIQQLPSQFLLAGYNTQIPLYFGSPIMKANGMFMLEPSFYSKMIATAIVIEFLTKKRMKVLLVFISAIVVSFSGTGFIILAIAALPIVLRLKPLQALLLAMMVLIPVYVLFDKGYGDVFTQRLEEFNTPDTSGHVRFIAPWLTYGEFLTLEDAGTILFGTGSGTLEHYHGREFTFDELSTVYKTAHPSSYIKLFVEYGLLGGVGFVIFLIYAFVTSTHNKLLTFCLFINYSFLTVSLLQPTTVYFCFMLCIFTAEKWKQEEEEGVRMPAVRGYKIS